MGHLNPPLSGSNVLTGTPPRVYFPSENSEKAGMDTRFTPFRAQRSYWHTASCLLPFEKQRESWHRHTTRVYPLRGTTRKLAHRLVSISDTVCNDPDPLLADIVLFELSPSGSPQDFKTRLLMEGFHPLINGVLFSSPTNVRHHTLIDSKSPK